MKTLADILFTSFFVLGSIIIGHQAGLIFILISIFGIGALVVLGVYSEYLMSIPWKKFKLRK